MSWFESESDLLLGLKLMLESGTHYGWLHLTRPVVDFHTPFDIADYAYHPLPDEPIRAGEAPPPPTLEAEVSANTVKLFWDTRWGNLFLESSTSLEPPVVWEYVATIAGGQFTWSLEEDIQRFYRVRKP